MTTLDQFIKSYPNFEKSIIQTFDDRDKNTPEWYEKDKSLVSTSKAKEVNRDHIRKLNDKGAGVFFSVNAMKWDKRLKKDVEIYNTWIVECDDDKKIDQQKLIKDAPIKPSIIIESQKSYHIYYLAQDATAENRERINRWLCDYYYWDVKICSDSARVFRLPDFNHLKDRNDPFPVKCIMMKDVKYTEEEMLKAFPYEKIEKKEVSKSKPKLKTWNIREVMWSQSSRYMLDRISWSHLVRWETIDYKSNSNWTDQIYVDNKSTSSWIDRNDMIWSSDNWWPTRIQRAEWYWNSKSDILKRFLEFCDDLVPLDFDRSKQTREIKKTELAEVEEERQKNKINTIIYGEKIDRGLLELMDTDPLQIMKRWRVERDEYLWWIYWWKIYLVGAETWTWKSTFVNKVASNLSKAWVKVARYSLEDRLEDIAKEDLFMETNRIRKRKNKKLLKRIHFVNWEYTHDNWKYLDWNIMWELSEAYETLKKNTILEMDKTREVTIQDVVEVMEEDVKKWVKVIVIDHLHYFQYEWDATSRHLQLEDAMQRINEVARKYNIAVFLVAHYNWKSDPWEANINSFKWSTGIKQIANIVIQLYRESEDDTQTKFKITKLRWPIIKHELSSTYDLETWEYTFTKTKEQKEKEKINLWKLNQ